MRQALVWGVGVVSVVLALPAQADTLARGQGVAAAFLRGEVGAIWAEMTPDMQRAIGAPEHLAALRGKVETDFGHEEEVLSEQVVRQGGHSVFTREARWSGFSQPVRLLVAFDQNNRIAGFWIGAVPVAAPSAHLNYETKARLRLPFEGAWHVVWGGREIEQNYHAIDAGQRFALDLLVLKEGRSHAGGPAVLENYHCWGRPILAPADAVVANAVDDLPDQKIGQSDPRNPLGNHVVLDFGNGEYGFLAHLKQGSVRVAKGDRVTSGMEIGRCGNSGNTSEPHLHFHLQNSPLFGQGEGLPAQFVNYHAGDALVERGEPTKGQTVQAAE